MCFAIVERLNVIKKRNGQHSGFVRQIATDHEYNAKLTDGMGKG